MVKTKAEEPELDSLFNRVLNRGIAFGYNRSSPKMIGILAGAKKI
jgi:hypothetical protein